MYIYTLCTLSTHYIYAVYTKLCKQCVYLESTQSVLLVESIYCVLGQTVYNVIHQ